MRHNLRRARSRAAGRKIWAVIKANAYGHGIERAVRGFADADGLALIDFEEARRARAARWTRPILMLEGCFEAGDVAICRELDLGVVVHDESQLRMLEQAPAGPPIGVYRQGEYRDEPARCRIRHSWRQSMHGSCSVLRRVSMA